MRPWFPKRPAPISLIPFRVAGDDFLYKLRQLERSLMDGFVVVSSRNPGQIRRRQERVPLLRPERKAPQTAGVGGYTRKVDPTHLKYAANAPKCPPEQLLIKKRRFGLRDEDPAVSQGFVT